MIQKAMLTEGAIHDGHRSLLATFRELVSTLKPGSEGWTDHGTLKGTVAFLRQSLLPFARSEEDSLRDSEEIVEEIAFEHAFIGVETDALARAVDDLLAAREAGSEPRPALGEEVRRRAQRLEAILELHVLKAEDRSAGRHTGHSRSVVPAAAARSPSPAPRQSPQAAAPALQKGQRDMTREEARDFLLAHEWGVLSTVGEAGPYGVPVAYGYDGADLFVATGPGRKASNLEQSETACLTMMRVVDGSRWSSVVVVGRAVRVTGLAGKLHAARSIQKHRPGGAGMPSGQDTARLRTARIFRITPVEMTGRARGEPAG